MSQELEVQTDLSTPGTAVMEAFKDAPLNPATWSMFAQIAKTIKGTAFVPEGLRASEPGILACMLYGHAQGLDPMIALSEISMIDGKPAMSAELLTAKIRAAGHTLRREEHVVDGAVTAITAHGIRRGVDGDSDSFTFTLDMARRAGLMTKNNWKNYPEAMLWARAASQLARMLFGDVFLGMSVYIPDELGAVTDEEGKPVDQEPAAPAEVPEEVAADVTPVEEPDAADGAGSDEEVDEEVQKAAAEALEEAFPEGLPPLTKDLVEASDSRDELLALATRYEVKHGKRDTIAVLSEKLMRAIKEAEPEATVLADGSGNEPSAPPAEGMDLPAVEPEPETPAPTEAARRDAMLARVNDALAHVAVRYPTSQLNEAAILTAASKQFDRGVESLDELTGEELTTIWDALPPAVQEAVIATEQAEVQA